MLLEVCPTLVDKDLFSASMECQSEDHIGHEKAFVTGFCNWYWLPQNFDRWTTETLRAALRSAGVAPGRRNKAVLAAMLASIDRGVPYYTRCNKQELWQFAIDRRLITVTNKGLTKQALVQHLEQSDADPSFTKFEELPAEIRNKIYVFHFSSFRYRLFAPAQPPITLISRLLRQESLPLFYSTCAFGIPILCGGHAVELHETIIAPGLILTNPSEDHKRAAPVNGVCHREHHHIDISDIEEYIVLRAPSAFGLLPRYVARWHSKVYRKYHQDIPNMALFVPHTCIDMHFGFDKKQNKVDFHVHGHCEEVHGPDCDLALDTGGAYCEGFESMEELGYLSKRILMEIWNHVDGAF